MGERVATHPLDISDHTLQINRRDTLFNDLWSRVCYSAGDWIPNIENKFFTPSVNEGLLEKSLDLIEERRENTMVQLAYY